MLNSNTTLQIFDILIFQVPLIQQCTQQVHEDIDLVVKTSTENMTSTKMVQDLLVLLMTPITTHTRIQAIILHSGREHTAERKTLIG